MEYIIGAIVMWFVLAVLFTWYQDSYNKAVEHIIALPLVIPMGIFVIVAGLLIRLWRFIQGKPINTFVTDNTPSVPEGKFRIGEE
jgi:hypothetical protein